MELVYDLATDTERVAQMQRVTRDTDGGLSAEPAVVGTDEWWAAISDGRIPQQSTEGLIARVYWASMGDWPEFTIETPEGDRSDWTREGDVTRYVEGLRARVDYVTHPWKDASAVMGSETKLAIRIWIEEIRRRSSGIAPGPGGIGYRIHRRSQVRRLLGPFKFLVRRVPR